MCCPFPPTRPTRPPALCSDAELEELSEVLYHDCQRIVQEVALYVLQEQGEEDRKEPPGGLF